MTSAVEQRPSEDCRQHFVNSSGWRSKRGGRRRVRSARDFGGQRIIGSSGGDLDGYDCAEYQTADQQ
jgi:hypothetical protein